MKDLARTGRSTSVVIWVFTQLFADEAVGFVSATCARLLVPRAAVSRARSPKTSGGQLGNGRAAWALPGVLSFDRILGDMESDPYFSISTAF